ncbi:unnamed protein product [Caenorhabditis nigoni]
MPSWKTIPDDVKKEILELLDYESRCSMRLCSKKDHALVNATNFKAKNFAISEVFSNMAGNKTQIRVDIDNFTIWFIGKENQTRVDRAWDGNVLEEFSEIKSENRYDVIRRFLDRWQQRFGMIHAEKISFVMFDQPPSAHWKIKCNKLTMYELRGGHDITWLDQCVSSKFEKLEITRTHGPSLPIDRRILETSRSLRIGVYCNMSDEQLDTVRAPDFYVKSDGINGSGIRRVLENFLKNGQMEDRTEITVALPENFEFKKLVPENVRYRSLEIPEWSSSVFEVKLLGGFENVHGIQNPRKLRVRYTPDKAEVSCEIWKRPRSESLPIIENYDSDSE